RDAELAGGVDLGTQRGRGADEVARRGREDRQQLVVAVGGLLHQEAVQGHGGVRVVFGGLPRPARGGGRPRRGGLVSRGVGGGEVGGGDGRAVVEGGPRLRQDAVAGGAAGGDDDGVADRRPVAADEGGVIAEDALLGRALPEAEVDSDVGLDVDDVQGVGV